MEDKQIKLSILVNTYNSEQTLEKAIDSVINQSYSNWELIILDNASTDNSVAMLDEYAHKDARITVLYGKENIGWAYGTTECLKHATGDYMTFLAADDYYTDSTAFGTIVESMNKYNPDIVWMGNQFVEYENGNYSLKQTNIPEFKEYSKEDPLGEVCEIINEIYYNSMFHFTRIDFLNNLGVDFSSNYYADCETMTYLMCNAKKMITIPYDFYALTGNTSKTKGAVIYKPFGVQWKCIKELSINKGKYDYRKLFYIASRILNNDIALMNIVANDGTVRDKKMNNIYLSREERKQWLLKDIVNDVYQDMLYYSDQIFWKSKLDDCLKKLSNSDEANFLLGCETDTKELNDKINRIYLQLELFEKVEANQGKDIAMYIIEECLDIFDEIKDKINKTEFDEIIMRLKAISG